MELRIKVSGEGAGVRGSFEKGLLQALGIRSRMRITEDCAEKFWVILFEIIFESNKKRVFIQ